MRTMPQPRMPRSRTCLEPRYEIAPIDLARDVQACIDFRRDMYVTSFGTTQGLEAEMGEGNGTYLEALRGKIAQLPEGNVHLWEDGRIVGQAEMRFIDESPDVGYVSLIYLVPRRRGRGLARLLHDHAATVFRARGMRFMRLSVCHSNGRAIASYRKLGWTAAGERAHPMRPMLVMEFALR